MIAASTLIIGFLIGWAAREFKFETDKIRRENRIMRTIQERVEQEAKQ